MIRRFIILSLMLVSLLGLNACDSEPPVLMKASQQFETVEKRDQHIAYMRTNHMDALKHKRDETMYNGIRTEEHSIVGCINCHVPESFNGKVLRHTDQEHFCTTCHTYVAAKLDCFECHVDHPMKTVVVNNSSSIDVKLKNINKLNHEELLALAFRYSKNKDISSDNTNHILGEEPESGGVSLENNIKTSLDNPIKKEAINE
ncbi:MAG: hypothetical protein V7749_02425 [Cocleimonas sp.]